MTPSHSEILRIIDQVEAQRSQINQAWTMYENSLAKQYEEIRAKMESALTPIWSNLSGLAETATQLFHEAYPPNWPDDFELDFHKLEHMSESDGIPIFYVPRADIVTTLLEASDLQERLSILEQRFDDIGQDCLDVLDAGFAEEVQDRGTLARKAAEAFVSGHFEAAQTLAVVVCDSYLKTYLKGDYKKMKKKLALNKSEEAALWPSLRFFLPMATAIPFLVEWLPHKDEPAPSTFSRHATIHGADLQQINQLHATIAIMLATTMTLALDAGISRYGSVEKTFNCFLYEEE